ncbi:MAG: hypothetical protein LBT48_04400 [Prevotellaceae bacterium]|jgi:hypothetical protein|nr:hypothetical protein [Prevotellaceae bacterium]
MNKNFLAWTLAAALSVGFAACKDEEPVVKEDPKPVDVTISVTLPSEYNGISLAGLSRDSVKIVVGSQTVYTQSGGTAEVTLEEGSYQVTATAQRFAEGNNENVKGLYAINFQGVKSAAVSATNTAVAVDLTVSGTPTFAPYGSIASSVDTIRLWYKGDTLDVASYFTPSLEPGRTGEISFEIAAKPQKKETGFGTNGAWEELPNTYYVIAADKHSVVAVDSLPAAWKRPDITDKARELKPAVLRAILTSGGEQIATKEIPIVQDSLVPELIKIVPSSTSDLNRVLISGTNTFTYATPYANGVTFNTLGWQGHYSDGSINENLTKDYVYVYDEDGTTLIGLEYKYHIVIDAENKNGSDAYGVREAGGTPISGYSATTVLGSADNQFYINRPEAAASTAGDEGYFYIYPYGTSKEHFAAEKYTVRLTTVTGIEIRPNDDYVEGAVSRKFRVGNASAVHSIFYVYLTVAEGPARPYIVNENGGVALSVVAGSWNNYDGAPILEGSVASPTQRNTGILKPGKSEGSTDPNDYAAFGWVKLTAKGVTAPAGTPITFKVAPKNKYNADGVPDPAWTLDITTKIYTD